MRVLDFQGRSAVGLERPRMTKSKIGKLGRNTRPGVSPRKRDLKAPAWARRLLDASLRVIATGVPGQIGLHMNPFTRDRFLEDDRLIKDK